MWWAILRDTTWFSVDVAADIVNACCLLHNFIKREQGVDVFERFYASTEHANTMTSKEKDRRAYKPWTTQLDAALINAMKDVMENGLIENGKFKPGAYKALEKKLFALFPKVDMKADPNIKSSVKTLKINFDAVQLLKSQSGYGWNDELKCPNIEDQVYDDFVKIHPECANKNRISYPTYDDMLLIFGKVQATRSKDYRGTWWHVSRRNCLELRERDMLVNELKKLDGLSEDQMFDATLLLLECNNKLRMFYRLDSIDEKKKFIMRMLRRLNA
ncbi:hypothetical protein LINPERPRIM_LOCUS37270 [Linum perenne]